MNNHVVGGIIFVVTWRVVGFKSAVVVTIAYYYGGGISGTGTGININGTDIDLFNKPSIEESAVEGNIIGDNDIDDDTVDVKDDDGSVDNHVDEYEIDDRYIADREIEGSVKDNEDSELDDFTGSDLDVPSEIPSDVASTTFEDLFIPTEQTVYSDTISDTVVDLDNIRDSDYGPSNDGTISEYDGPDFGDDPALNLPAADNPEIENVDDGNHTPRNALEALAYAERIEVTEEMRRYREFMKGRPLDTQIAFIKHASYIVKNMDSLSATYFADTASSEDGIFVDNSIYNKIGNKVSTFKQFFYDIYDFFSSFFDDDKTKTTKELVKKVVSNESTIDYDLQKLNAKVNIIERQELLDRINIPSELEKIEANKNVSDKITAEYFLGYDSSTGKCISDHIPELLSKSADVFVQLHKSNYSGVISKLTYENGDNFITETLKKTFTDFYSYEAFKDILSRTYKEIPNIKETLKICQGQLLYPDSILENDVKNKLIRKELVAAVDLIIDSNFSINDAGNIILKRLGDSDNTLLDVASEKLGECAEATLELDQAEEIFGKACRDRVTRRSIIHGLINNDYSASAVYRGFNEIVESSIDSNLLTELDHTRFKHNEYIKSRFSEKIEDLKAIK